ncbi:MAG: DUF4256 domain-containing protein [Spirochaetaceae bacterium]|nr:DUF4256 domain-containing protein [Spirochaetaceae bacterium]
MSARAAEYNALLELLETRFRSHPERHPDLQWEQIEERLRSNSAALHALYEMEVTGGEPDVIARDLSDIYEFFDCSTESPSGRRSLCYDDEALARRKANRPAGSALGMASAMGIAILDEERYRKLQSLGEFDTKTSSWILTPESVRRLGGALFCDRRYGQVFTYHNGAESYYSSRGFRGYISI